MATLSIPTRLNSKRSNTGGLLDRYVLPKVALAVISVASLVGVYLTMTTHGAPLGWVVVRWVHLAALGILAGGAMWWGVFLKRSKDEDSQDAAQTTRFALAQQQRFRAISGGALLLVLLTAPHLFWFGRLAQQTGERTLWLSNVIVLGVVLLAYGWRQFQPLTETRAFDRTPIRLLWSGLLLVLLLTGLLDARLTFPTQPSAWLLRPIHLIAFALWIGGAVWNIFVAVPAGQKSPTIPVVIAAAEQLERFRWAVRVILPTLLVTGLLQALPYTGLSPAALLTPFGLLILFKIALVFGLIVIFITCPLWRACSPIRGMCDLAELNAPPAPLPTRRLDNRGKACAGFVRVQRILDELAPGETLEMLSTDRISWWELPAWLEMNGHTLVEREQSGRLWWRSYRYLIRRGGAKQETDKQTPPQRKRQTNAITAPAG